MDNLISATSKIILIRYLFVALTVYSMDYWVFLDQALDHKVAWSL